MNIHADFKGYFEATAPGSVTPFAAGRLVMSKPEATYEGPDGLECCNTSRKGINRLARPDEA